MVFSYTVRCEFTRQDVCDAWIEWLRKEHLADVCRAGAQSAELVRCDGEAIAAEVRYRFETRRDFERYEREHAQRLRADGLARFPLTLGLSYRRTTGEILARYGETRRENPPG